jgi:quinoprotein glucose dehydrogenase
MPPQDSAAQRLATLASRTPIWPIEERPVPQGQVPGEWYSPTQPIPTTPPAFDQQGVSDKDLFDYTPE